MTSSSNAFGTAHPVGGDDLRLLAAVGDEAEIAAGQLLIERGTHGSGLYVVLDGSVLVEAPGRTRELGPGSCVGEVALLSPNGRRTARVRASTDVRVLAVARSAFECLCADDPGLLQRLAA